MASGTRCLPNLRISQNKINLVPGGIKLLTFEYKRWTIEVGSLWDEAKNLYLSLASARDIEERSIKLLDSHQLLQWF